MPDYHLYDKWVQEQLNKGVKPKELVYYTDYSIGFTTRGCIRRCKFCVNRNYHKCEIHSSLEEFVDESRPYICLLDDNIFACPKWRDVFDTLNKSGKRFQFKQGVDERLLTDEKCYEINPYRGFYIAIAWWCNQPSKFKKQSFREFCESNQARTKKECAAMRYLKQVEQDFPDIAEKYFDIKFENLNRFKK